LANLINEIFHLGHAIPAAAPAEVPTATPTPVPQPAAIEEPAMSTVPAAVAAPVSAPPPVAAPAPRKSFIKVIAADAKSVFLWLAQPKVQNSILAGEALGEAVADAVDPALIGLNPIINSWTQEIFKAQALAAAAGAPDGNGEQKAAMVLNTLTPQVVQFAEQNKLPTPTGDKLLQANTLLYNFLEILGGGDPSVPTTTTTVKAG
jgi:hypothetical protein